MDGATKVCEDKEDPKAFTDTKAKTSKRIKASNGRTSYKNRPYEEEPLKTPFLLPCIIETKKKIVNMQEQINKKQKKGCVKNIM